MLLNVDNSRLWPQSQIAKRHGPYVLALVIPDFVWCVYWRGACVCSKNYEYRHLCEEFMEVNHG